jgi:endonuclease-3
MQLDHVEQVYTRLSKTYKIFSENDNEWDKNGLSNTPFKSLVSVKLSTMTNTKRVIKAALALYEEISTPEDLLNLSDEKLVELIKPVAHYNRKAQHLKEMCKQLIEKHNGEVPRTREELIELQGVGRKCVDIMMNFTFNEDAIAVDSHVHRVLNRVGIVNTKNHIETADIINEITPLKFKKHAHEWLIQHGMQVCVALKPQCSECSIADLCKQNQI